MTTQEQLIERYGTLLSLDDLVEVLKHSLDGLHIALHGNILILLAGLSLVQGNVY